MNWSTALALVNTIQSKVPASRHTVSRAPRSFGGAIHRRRQNRLRTALLQHLDQLAGLFTRSRDDDPPAEERALVEPSQMLAQASDSTHDEQRGGVVARPAGNVAERAHHRSL